LDRAPTIAHEIGDARQAVSQRAIPRTARKRLDDEGPEPVAHNTAPLDQSGINQFGVHR
jgi:hypothetical protein